MFAHASRSHICPARILQALYALAVTANTFSDWQQASTFIPVLAKIADSSQ